MGKPICGMCSGTEFKKEGENFVCQGCGMQYTMEEAKKLMNENAGQPEENLSDLYRLARRARDDNNTENARRYYDQLIVKDPHNWEPNFYTVYFQSKGCVIRDIPSAAINLLNCSDTVLTLVRDGVSDPEEQKQVIERITTDMVDIGQMLKNAQVHHYNKIDARVRSRFGADHSQAITSLFKMMYVWGDQLFEIFGQTYFASCAEFWICGNSISLCQLYLAPSDRQKMEQYAEKIRKVKPEYTVPAPTKPGGGCYVATAVYGSYDCPEVWTLRRFRDETLAQNVFGRAFIRTYYATSPTLVKWFGKKTWFTRFVQPKLNRLVARLNEKGVKNTPYEDRNW